MIRAACSALIMLLAANYSTQLQADSAQPELNVWVYGLLPSKQMTNLFAPFFLELEQVTGYQYRVTSHRELETVIDECSNQSLDLAVASSPVTQRLMDECNMQVLVETHQKIEIFSRRDNPVESLSDVRVLGLVEDIKASQLALSEFKRLGLTVDIVWYPNFLELVLNHNKDNVDAIAVTQAIITMTQTMRDKWLPIHKLGGTGVAHLMVAKELEKGVKADIHSALLAEPLKSQNLWMEKLGLGPFQPPSAKPAP